MSQRFTFKAPRTITFTCGDVPKITAAFLLIDATEEPLPRGFLDAAAKAIGVSKAYLHYARKLKRLFAENPSYREAMIGPVRAGTMSVMRALETIADVKAELAKLANRKPAPQKPRRPVYRTICDWPEPLSAEKIAFLQNWLGVSRSTVMDAIALRRKLSSDRALGEEWHGKALVEILQPRTILNRIGGKTTRTYQRRATANRRS